MKKMNVKKISAIIMTAAILLQSQMAFASDLFSDGASVDIFSAPVEIAVEQPASQPTVQEAPTQEIVVVEEAPAQEIVVVEEAPAQEIVVVEEVPAQEIAAVEEAPAQEIIEEVVPTEVKNTSDEISVETAEVTDEALTEEMTIEVFEEAPVEEGFKTDFRYEDATAIITANALEAAQLPMNTEMVVVRLAEGTAEFEEAKAATQAALGTCDESDYIFYDVTFTVDGQEVEPEDGTVAINIEFKTVQIDSAETQSVLHIEETTEGQVVRDVTAYAEEGSNMKSVDFAF